MASTGLLGINPYRGGNVAVDISSKPTQLAIGLMQKQQAKAEAVDKYFKDYEKSLNPAGLSKGELDMFTKKLKEVQNYGIQNKQAITNPSKYGYDAQSNLMAGFKDLQGLIEQGKQATAERKAFKDYINQAIKSGKHVSDNYLDILNNAMKPVGAGYVAPDLSQIDIYDPYDDVKFTSAVSKNVKPIEVEKNIPELDEKKQDTGYSKKVKKNILGIDSQKAIGDNAYYSFKSDKGTQEYFNELFNNDKETVNKLNKTFEEVYKQKIQTPADLSRAYAIAKIPKEQVTFEGDLELNDIGKYNLWLKQEGIRHANNLASNTAMAKILATQGAKDLLTQTIGNYRTGKTFSDNNSLQSLNVPVTLVKDYVKEIDMPIGVQKTLKEKGLKYEKNVVKLEPVLGEDQNGNIFLAYPKIDEKGKQVGYDWNNKTNVTNEIKGRIISDANTRVVDVLKPGKKTPIISLIKK
jgi:predicted DNA-binding ArsR family transcriptional regulator